MEGPKRKIIFTERERLLLKQCVLASDVLNRNRKIHRVSNYQKALAWEEITKNFNSKVKHSQRTVKQLRKLWDNIKFRRKIELGQRPPTWTEGVAPYSPSLDVDEPESDPLEGLGMDLKQENPIEIDTMGTEVYVDIPQTLPTTILEAKQKTEDYIRKEAELRVTRVSNQIRHDEELHAIRMKEARVRIELAEAELELFKLKNEMLLTDVNKNNVIH